MPLVYRFESMHGGGVYMGGGPGYNASSDGGRHPCPYDDGSLGVWWDSNPYYIRQEYYCGFESMESLKAWFPESKWEVFDRHNERFADNPMCLVVFDVADCDIVYGNQQVMFHRENSTEVSRDAYFYEKAKTLEDA